MKYMRHATSSYTYKLNVAYFIIPKDFSYSEAPCTTSITICHLKTLLTVFQRCLFTEHIEMIIASICAMRLDSDYAVRFTILRIEEKRKKKKKTTEFQLFFFAINQSISPQRYNETRKVEKVAIYNVFFSFLRVAASLVFHRFKVRI